MPHEPITVASALHDPVACAIEQGGRMADVKLAAAARQGADAAERSAPLSRVAAFSQLAAARLGRSDFGWRAGMRFDPENLGGVGRAALRAPTLLRDAFSCVQGASQLRLSIADGEAALNHRIFDPDIRPREQDAALTLAVLAQLVRRAAPGPGAVSHVALELGSARIPPGIDCPVSYDAPCNAPFFPAGPLDRPMPRGDAATWRDGARGAVGIAAGGRARSVGTASAPRSAGAWKTPEYGSPTCWRRAGSARPAAFRPIRPHPWPRSPSVRARPIRPRSSARFASGSAPPRPVPPGRRLLIVTRPLDPAAKR